MNYYYIRNTYERSNGPMFTGHVVRANSKKEANKICEKYGIAYPMKAKIKSRRVLLLNESNEAEYCGVLHRRRKGWGGKIFYEQDNQLKTEKS